MPRVVESCAVEGVQRGEKGNYGCFLDARSGKRIPRLGMITNLTGIGVRLLAQNREYV